MIVSVIHRTAECMCRRCGARLGKCEHTSGEDAEARFDIKLTGDRTHTLSWTKGEMAAAQDLDAKGVTHREIADLLSRSECSVTGKLLRLSREPQKPSVLRRPYKVAANG